MDFALDAQHEEIRRTVRDFADRRIAPVADELERRGEFPHDIIREAASIGLLGALLQQLGLLVRNRIELAHRVEVDSPRGIRRHLAPPPLISSISEPSKRA